MIKMLHHGELGSNQHERVHEQCLAQTTEKEGQRMKCRKVESFPSFSHAWQSTSEIYMSQSDARRKLK